MYKGNPLATGCVYVVNVQGNPLATRLLWADMTNTKELSPSTQHKEVQR
jgi:hypothetical protein